MEDMIHQLTFKLAEVVSALRSYDETRIARLKTNIFTFPSVVLSSRIKRRSRSEENLTYEAEEVTISSPHKSPISGEEEEKESEDIPREEFSQHPMRLKVVKKPNQEDIFTAIVDIERDILTHAPTLYSSLKKYFQSIRNEELDSEDIYDLIDQAVETLASVPAINSKWAKTKVNLAQVVEDFVFECLHPKLFHMDDDARAKNEQMQEKFYVLQNRVTMDLLDIPQQFQIPSLIQYSQNELRKVNNLKTPLHKLILVEHIHQNIIKVIATDKGLPTADEIFPLFVYTVLQANPDHLMHNLGFIQKYVRKRMLIGEHGYLLTNLSAAIAFLDAIDGFALMKGELRTAVRRRTSTFSNGEGKEVQ